MITPRCFVPRSWPLRAGAALATLVLLSVGFDARAQQAPQPEEGCGGLSVERQADKFVLYEDGAWTRSAVDVVVDFDDAFSQDFRQFALDALTRAVATWNEALCEGLRLQPPTQAVQLASGEPVPEGQIRLSVVTDALNSSSGRRLFGFTVNRAESGSYLSSRIFVDGANWSWTTGNLCSTDPDLTGVFTHELGHALGIDHSEDPTAVMRGRADVDETRWLLTLRDDDVQALATRYGCANNSGENDPSAAYDFVCTDCSACDGVCAATSVGPRCLPACLEPGSACGDGTCSLVYDTDVDPPVCALACVPTSDPCAEPVEIPEDTGCGLAGRSSSPAAPLLLAAALLLVRRRSVAVVGRGI